MKTKGFWKHVKKEGSTKYADMPPFQKLFLECQIHRLVQLKYNFIHYNPLPTIRKSDEPDKKDISESDEEDLFEDDIVNKAGPIIIKQLYGGVRKIHYKMYFHYLYFDFVKWSYLQGMVIVPYIALAPTIITGAVTLGFVQQISRAFGRVETSLQYLVRSWPIIVELISVFRRLNEFEKKLISDEISTQSVT